jgi:predicted permease
MTGFLQDIRFAFRYLKKSGGFVAVAVATLAIGIGATTAIFSVVDAILVESPPYRDADRLVLVWHRLRALDAHRVRVSGPDVAEYREAADVFEGLAFVASPADVTLQGETDDEHVRLGVVSPNLFDVLGVGAALGRTFLAGEGVLSVAALQDTAFIAPPGPVLLAHSLWRDRYAEDASIVGRTIRLSGASMVVVGVLPREFELLLPPGTGLATDIDVWTPLATPLAAFERPEGLRDQDSDNTGVVIGRLARSASLTRARDRASAIAAAQRDRIPFYAEADLQIDVLPLRDEAVRQARPTIAALMGAVVMVLLIACMNVANLLLARGVDRRGEMAVRSAIGAGRGRLIRQVLAEGSLLALAGVVLGLLLAAWGVQALLAMGPENLPRAGEVDFDGTVLAFALLTTAGAALLFSMAPALVMARDAAAGVRGASARVPGRRWGTSRALVVAELSMSFALLVGAGLMFRTTGNLARVEPGFEPDGLLTFSVTLPGATVGGPAARAEFFDRLERRIRDLPGVEAVGLVGGLPLGGTVWRQPYGHEGSDPLEWSRNEANFRVISAEYFRAMGTRLLAGRAFTPQENLHEDDRVAIIDAKLADRVAPGGDAVGRTIGFPLDGDPVWATVVGIVEDVRFQDLRDAGRESIYVPYRQEASRTVSLAVRTDGDPAALISRIRDAAREVAGATVIPVYEFREMREYVDRALAPARFALTLVGVFAALALALAAVGLAGVVSYAVGRRTREFGIRIALGATGADILGGVLREGVALAVVGIAGGVVVTAAGATAVRGLLFGVGGLDLPTYVAVALAMVAVTLAASWLPARQAASVEPFAALKQE